MIYLDQAATSFPKPAPVLAAMRRWFEELGVSAERGNSQRCVEVARLVRGAREGLAARFDLPAERVAFTSGATESINLFLRGFLRQGDRVLTTAFEHSSVVRPLVQLGRERGIELLVLPPDRRHGLDTAAVRDALAAFAPRLFVFTHASNVTGAVFAGTDFCAVARAAACTTLVDVSQTAGHFDLALAADAYAGSAHKALHGPPGLGFLAVREGIDVRGQKQGGTGSSTALDEHPQQWPTAFEAGTANTPAIVGLGAALAWLAAQPAGTLLSTALARVTELEAQLEAQPQIRLLLPPPGPRVPTLSFVHAELDPAEIGAILDAAGIHVRTGHHCAPWLHQHLGTARGGTVRVSPGPLISAADIRAVSAALVG
jgi:selenocysteine lyase/cysteine desulfurase